MALEQVLHTDFQVGILSRLLFAITKTRLKVSTKVGVLLGLTPSMSNDLKIDIPRADLVSADTPLFHRRSSPSLASVDTLKSPRRRGHCDKDDADAGRARTMSLAEMPDLVILHILKSLPCIHRLTATCSSIRRIAQDNHRVMPRCRVKSLELRVSTNVLNGRPSFKLLKQRRTLLTRCEVVECTDINAVVPPYVHAHCDLVFTDGVNVLALSKALKELHVADILSPVSFIFAGGSNHSETITGANLTWFTAESFVDFCQFFTPSLRNLQIATNRFFHMSDDDHHILLELINIFENIGITHERPQLSVSLTTIIAFIGAGVTVIYRRRRRFVCENLTTLSQSAWMN